MTAEKTLDKIRFAEAERVEKCVGEQDAASALLRKFFPAHRRNFKAWEEKKVKAADMLTKVKKLYEQARGRVVCLCAVDESELSGKIDTLTDKVEAKNLEL